LRRGKQVGYWLMGGSIILFAATAGLCSTSVGPNSRWFDLVGYIGCAGLALIVIGVVIVWIAADRERRP